MIVEQCLSRGATSVLLHAQSLPDDFYDLSSGQAGAFLQKMRTYGIRVAIVYDSDRDRPSSRFGEMVAEENRGTCTRFFDSTDAARQWLATML